MEVAMVGRYQCEESATWSDDKKGTPYEDPDDTPKKTEPEPEPEPEPDPGPVDYSKYEYHGSYGDISAELYWSYQKLIQDPNKWSESISDEEAKKVATHFLGGDDIEFSYEFTWLGSEFLWEAAPCNAASNSKGVGLTDWFL